MGKEKDESSKKRHYDVKKQLQQIEEDLKPLLLKFEAERGRIDELRSLKEKLEDLKVCNVSIVTFIDLIFIIRPKLLWRNVRATMTKQPICSTTPSQILNDKSRL